MLTLTRKPPAASTLRSVPMATPSPTAELVCSLSARYMAKSSAISPDRMGIMPVYGAVYWLSSLRTTLSTPAAQTASFKFLLRK